MSAFIRRMIVSVLVPDADCRPFLVKWLLSGCETIRSMTLLINEIFETGLYLLKVFVSNLVFFQTWSNKCTFQLIWNDPSIRWSIHQFSYGRQHYVENEAVIESAVWMATCERVLLIQLYISLATYSRICTLKKLGSGTGSSRSGEVVLSCLDLACSSELCCGRMVQIRRRGSNHWYPIIREFLCYNARDS